MPPRSERGRIMELRLVPDSVIGAGFVKPPKKLKDLDFKPGRIRRVRESEIFPEGVGKGVEVVVRRYKTKGNKMRFQAMVEGVDRKLVDGKGKSLPKAVRRMAKDLLGYKAELTEVQK